MKKSYGRRFVLLAGALSATAASALLGAGDSSLPTLTCVEQVRAARIARQALDAVTARRLLEAAVELPGCDLPALSALLELVRGDVDGVEVAELRDRLSARLGDAATALPRGFLTQLARLGFAAADPAGDRALLATLERRLGSAAASGKELALAERVEIFTVRAELEGRLGLEDAERASVARLLELEPTENLRWRALLLDVDAGRWPSVLDLLAPMLAEPGAPETLRYLRIQALSRLGRFDEMLVEIEAVAPPPTALAQAPAVDVETLGAVAPIELPSASAQRITNYIQLLVNVAWTMRDLGRDAEAAALFRRVLRFDPERQDASLALLHLYGSAEERAAAERAAAARRASETDPLALFEEGSDLLGAGDLAGARELLARAAPALAGSGYAEAAWYNLGSAAFKLERWEEAASAFAEAIAVHPERAESHFKSGVAFFRLGRWSDAVGSLRRALELQPDRRDVHYFLAGSYGQLGDTAAAARHRALFEEKR